jgi:hypothetical protein
LRARRATGITGGSLGAWIALRTLRTRRHRIDQIFEAIELRTHLHRVDLGASLGEVGVEHR